MAAFCSRVMRLRLCAARGHSLGRGVAPLLGLGAAVGWGGRRPRGAGELRGAELVLGPILVRAKQAEYGKASLPFTSLVDALYLLPPPPPQKKNYYLDPRTPLY